MRTKLALQTWPARAADIFREAPAAMRATARRKSPSINRALPPLRSPTEQWARVAGVVAEAQSRAQYAVQSHAGASAQLDAATYALQRLREEMAPAFMFSISRPSPPPLTPSAFRREQFRRREPLAA